MQENKDPDLVNPLVQCHSGPVLVQMVDPKKWAGPTLVQMVVAQAEEMALVLQHLPEQ